MAGLQCLKRLYLETYHPEWRDVLAESQQALLQMGTRVGELARHRFPDGLLILQPRRSQAAIVHTQQALQDESVPAVYEAAVTFDEILVRPDILRRVGKNEVDLIEVKSGTRVKSEHIPDVALQLYVLEAAGVKVRRAYLMHLNNGYVYQGGDYDLAALFRLQDVTPTARAFIGESLPDYLEEFKSVLSGSETPDVKIGPHCTSPYQCPYYAYCRHGTPKNHIEQLPYSRGKAFEILRQSGIEDIRDIPEDFAHLTPMQQRVRDSVVSGLPYVDEQLGVQLATFVDPVHFLDFETVNPALPIFPGTRPYQVLPFQWSLHIQDGGGQLSHFSYLHQGEDDPRRGFVESLLRVVNTSGTIVIYSTYEIRVLRQLAEKFPEYKGRLLDLVDRMFDLYKTVRQNYYHPELHGSFSIKSVVPVLAPDLSYKDLDIQDGSVASLIYGQILAGEIKDERAVSARQALEAYCRLDTEGLVRIVEALASKAVTT